MNKAVDRAAPQSLNNSSSASILNLVARGGPFFQVNMVLNVHRNYKASSRRGGGEGVWRWGGGEGDYILIATLSPPE